MSESVAIQIHVALGESVDGIGRSLSLKQLPGMVGLTVSQHEIDQAILIGANRGWWFLTIDEATGSPAIQASSCTENTEKDGEVSSD